MENKYKYGYDKRLHKSMDSMPSKLIPEEDRAKLYAANVIDKQTQIKCEYMIKDVDSINDIHTTQVEIITDACVEDKVEDPIENTSSGLMSIQHEINNATCVGDTVEDFINNTSPIPCPPFEHRTRSRSVSPTPYRLDGKKRIVLISKESLIQKKNTSADILLGSSLRPKISVAANPERQQKSLELQHESLAGALKDTFWETKAPNRAINDDNARNYIVNTQHGATDNPSKEVGIVPCCINKPLKENNTDDNVGTHKANATHGGANDTSEKVRIVPYYIIKPLKEKNEVKKTGALTASNSALIDHNYSRESQTVNSKKKGNECVKNFYTDISVDGVNSNSHPFKCNNCEKRFRHKGRLIQHLRKLHSGNDNMDIIDSMPTFICDYCGSKYCQKKNLLFHITGKHTEFMKKEIKVKKEVLKCDYCQNKYQNKQRLFLHILKNHTGNKESGTNFEKKTILKWYSDKKISSNVLLSQIQEKHPDIQNLQQESLDMQEESQDKKDDPLKTEQTYLDIHQEYSNIQEQEFSNMQRIIVISSVDDDGNKHSKPFKCNHCDKRFRLKKRFVQHLRKLHSTIVNTDSIPTFICDYCGEKFILRHDLVTHIKYIHATMKYKKGEIFKCEYCQEEFRLEQQLIKHILLLNHIIEPLDLQDKSLDIQQEFSDTHDDKVNININSSVADDCDRDRTTLKCYHYDKRYLNKELLNRHIQKRKLSKNLPSYSCDDCGLRYVQRVNLLEHIRRTHTVEIDKRAEKLKYEFRCDHCRKIYFNKDNLIQHLRRKHMVEIDKKAQKLKCESKCNHCDKTYYNKDNLIQHLQKLKFDNDVTDSANSIPTYDCVHCGLKYLQRPHLLSHMRKKHTVGNNEKVKRSDCEFKCNHCGKIYSYKERLLRHLQKLQCSTPKFKCDHCSLKFIRRTYLLWHMRNKHVVKTAEILSSEKKSILKCYCDKIFDSKANFLRHIKTKHSSKQGEHFNLQQTQSIQDSLKRKQDESSNIFEKSQVQVGHLEDPQDIKKEPLNMQDEYEDKENDPSRDVQDKYQIIPQVPLDMQVESQDTKLKSSDIQQETLDVPQDLLDMREESQNEQQLINHILSLNHFPEHQKFDSMPTLPKFVCDYCGLKFVRKSFLIFHIESKHQVKKYNNMSLIFKCDFCQEEHHNEQQLINHILTLNHILDSGKSSDIRHLPPDNDHTDCVGSMPTFICDYCGIKYLREKSLLAHRRKKHQVRKQKKGEIFKCFYCPKQYLIEGRLKLHIHKEHESSESKSMFECQRRQRKPNAFKCNHCDKIFYQKGRLIQHYRKQLLANENTDSMPKFVCDYCGLKYILKNNLITHMRNKHTVKVVSEADIVKCDYCQKEYRHEIHLLQHIQTKHANQSQDGLTRFRFQKQHPDIKDLKQPSSDLQQESLDVQQYFSDSQQIISDIQRDSYDLQECFDIQRKSFHIQSESSAVQQHSLDKQKKSQNTQNGLLNIKQGCSDSKKDYTDGQNEYQDMRDEPLKQQGHLDVHGKCSALPQEILDLHQINADSNVVDDGNRILKPFKHNNIGKSHYHKGRLLQNIQKQQSGNEEKLDSMPTFICDYCGLKYSQKVYLISHMKLKHTECLKEVKKAKIFKCDYCTKKYQIRQNLFIHILRKHAVKVSNTNEFEKELSLKWYCDTKNRCEENVVSHIHVQHPEIQYVQLESLDMQENSHVDEDNPVNTEHASLNTQQELLHEQEVYQGMEKESPKIEQESSNVHQKSLDAQQELLNMCKESQNGPFKTQHKSSDIQQASLHILKEAKDKKDFVKIKANLSLIDDCDTVLKPKPFECNYCDKRYHHKGSLIQHLRKSQPEVTEDTDSVFFICDYCGVKCSQRRYLLNHMRNKHPFRKNKMSVKFKCDFCPKKYRNRQMLFIHILRNHKVNKESDTNQFEKQTSLHANKENVVSHIQEQYSEIQCVQLETLGMQEKSQVDKEDPVNIVQASLETQQELLNMQELSQDIENDPQNIEQETSTIQQESLHTQQELLYLQERSRKMQDEPLKLQHESLDIQDFLELQEESKDRQDCEKRYQIEQQLVTHIQREHVVNKETEMSEKKTVLKCYCDQEFSSKSHFQTHIQERHSDPLIQELQRVHQGYLAGTPETSSVSKKTVRHLSYLNRVETNIENATYDDIDNPKQNERHEYALKPSKCYNEAMKPDVLTEFDHASINHVKKTPFVTPSVKKRTISKGCIKNTNTEVLDILVDDANSNNYPFKCNHCRKKFRHKGRLIQHLRKLLDNEDTEIAYGMPTFICKYCGLKYLSKGNLATHIRKKHTIIKDKNSEIVKCRRKLFKCNSCDKSYYHKGLLMLHLRKLQPNNEETDNDESMPKFTCDYCQKGYSLKKRLIFHIKNKHAFNAYSSQKKSMFKCHCDKEFNSKADLMNHIQTKLSSKQRESLNMQQCQGMHVDHLSTQDAYSDIRQKSSNMKQESSYVQHDFSVMQEKSIDIQHESIYIQEKSIDIQQKSLAMQEKPIAIHHESLDIREESTDIQHEYLHMQRKSADIGQESLDIQEISIDIQRKSSAMLGGSEHIKDEPLCVREGSETEQQSLDMQEEYLDMKSEDDEPCYVLDESSDIGQESLYIQEESIDIQRISSPMLGGTQHIKDEPLCVRDGSETEQLSLDMQEEYLDMESEDDEPCYILDESINIQRISSPMLGGTQHIKDEPLCVREGSETEQQSLDMQEEYLDMKSEDDEPCYVLDESSDIGQESLYIQEESIDIQRISSPMLGGTQHIKDEPLCVRDGSETEQLSLDMQEEYLDMESEDDEPCYILDESINIQRISSPMLGGTQHIKDEPLCVREGSETEQQSLDMQEEYLDMESEDDEPCFILDESSDIGQEYLDIQEESIDVQRISSAMLGGTQHIKDKPLCILDEGTETVQQYLNVESEDDEPCYILDESINIQRISSATLGGSEHIKDEPLCVRDEGSDTEQQSLDMQEEYLDIMESEDEDDEPYYILDESSDIEQESKYIDDEPLYIIDDSSDIEHESLDVLKKSEDIEKGPLDINPEISWPSSLEEETSRPLQVTHGDMIDFSKLKHNKRYQEVNINTSTLPVGKQRENASKRPTTLQDTDKDLNFVDLELESELRTESSDPIKEIELPYGTQLESNLVHNLDLDLSENRHKGLPEETTIFNPETVTIKIEPCEIEDGLCNCLDIFKDSEMTRQENNTTCANPEVIKCKNCQMTFPSQLELLDHMHYLINKQVKLYADDGKKVLVCAKNAKRPLNKPFFYESDILVKHRVYEKLQKTKFTSDIVEEKRINDEKKHSEKPLDTIACCRCCSKHLPINSWVVGRYDKICIECKRIDNETEKRRKSVKTHLNDSIKNKPFETCGNNADCESTDDNLLENTHRVFNKIPKETYLSQNNLEKDSLNDKIEFENDIMAGTFMINDDDLLKPVRVAEEKILVQPHNPKLCKSCLAPLEITDNTGQNKTTHIFCDKCKALDSTTKRKSDENRRKFNDSVSKFCCLICKCKFRSSFGLKQHVASTHLL